MKTLDELQEAWRSSDKEWDESRVRAQAAYDLWYWDRSSPAKMAAMLNTADEAEAAHARWRVAFERYFQAKRARHWDQVRA